MQFPLEIGYGKFAISSHLIFETLAYIIGFRYFLYLRKRHKDTLSDANRMWLLIAAIFGALLGSRLVGAFENPMEFAKAENKFLYIFSNKTIAGGLLGGLYSVEVVKKIIHEKASSGDLYTYPLLLAMCIGRIGCFTTGIHEQTYGIETTFFTGMNLGDGLLRHPIMLYEIGYLILVFIFLKMVEKHNTFQVGNRFKIFMILYLFFRVLSEFIKPGIRFDIGLGTVQLVCILGLAYYCKTTYFLIFKPTKLFIRA